MVSNPGTAGNGFGHAMAVHGNWMWISAPWQTVSVIDGGVTTTHVNSGVIYQYYKVSYIHGAL